MRARLTRSLTPREVSYSKWQDACFTVFVQNSLANRDYKAGHLAGPLDPHCCGYLIVFCRCNRQSSSTQLSMGTQMVVIHLAIVFIYFTAISSAQSEAGTDSAVHTQNPLNLTSFPPSKNVTEATKQISLGCQMVEEVIKLNTFNSSGSSPSSEKLLRLENLVNISNSVMEKICVWMRTVFGVEEVFENGSCSYSNLQDYCLLVKDILSNF